MSPMKTVCPKHQQGYVIGEGCPYCLPVVQSVNPTAYNNSRFGKEIDVSNVTSTIIDLETPSGSRFWLCNALTWGLLAIVERSHAVSILKYNVLVHNAPENPYSVFLEAVCERGHDPFEKTPFRKVPGPTICQVGTAELGVDYVRLGTNTYEHFFGSLSRPDLPRFLEALCKYAGYTP